MYPIQIARKVFSLRSGRLILAALFLSLLLGNLAQPKDSFAFPEGKQFLGGEMMHRYTVTGTTSGAGKEALQRIVDAKNEELQGFGLPSIVLFSGPTARIYIQFDHVRDIRDDAGVLLPGSDAEQFRVVQGVLGYWNNSSEYRYVFFIFDTILRSNNATPPNNEEAAIQRSIQIGKMEDSGEVENLNYRAIEWKMESLTDPDRWIELKAKFTYDLDFHLVTSFPVPISEGTHVAEINVSGKPLDVVFRNLPPQYLFAFDRRFYRVEVLPREDIKKLKLKVSTPDSDVQVVFDHTEWNTIREEVFTSSTFLRVY